MPNGAKPAGIVGSEKLPDSVVGAKFLSKTSTVPFAKLVANRKLPPAFEPIAKPLYTAPATTVGGWAELSSTVGFHPSIQPVSDAKMNSAGAVVAPLVTLK